MYNRDSLSDFDSPTYLFQGQQSRSCLVVSFCGPFIYFETKNCYVIGLYQAHKICIVILKLFAITNSINCLKRPHQFCFFEYPKSLFSESSESCELSCLTQNCDVWLNLQIVHTQSVTMLLLYICTENKHFNFSRVYFEL